MIAPRRLTRSRSTHADSFRIGGLGFADATRAHERTKGSSNAERTSTFAGQPEDSQPGIIRSRVFWLRILFALDVIGAGVPGLLILAAPQVLSGWFFAESSAGGPDGKLLGCVWLALSACALQGVFRPLTFSPLLLMQLVYKSIWLLAIALPAALSGQSVSLVPVIVFTAWVVAVGAALPWRTILLSGHNESSPRSRK